MTLDRVPEILDFYGPDTMLLIGGSLLSARDQADRRNGRFVERVAGYFEDKTMDEERRIRRAQGDGFRWEGVELLAYKEEGSAPFKAITRQVLFQRPELQCELRYFEMQPGGHSRWSGTSTRMR